MIFKRYASVVANPQSTVSEASARMLTAEPEAAGQRLDQFLAARLDVSRARVQELIRDQKILLNGAPAKASSKLRGGEGISILGLAERPALRAMAEEIPLDIVYE